MKKLTEYISKKVITFSDGKEIGYILSPSVNKEEKKFKGLIVCDEDSEKELFLSLSKVIAENDDCIFIEREEECEFLLQEENYSPIGKQVFAKDGTDLGKVEECLLNGDKAAVLVTNKCEINVKNISSFGEKYIFVGKKNKKKIPFENKDIKIPSVKIQTEKKEKNNEKIMPIKLVSSTSSLLNKVATCDIIGLNNEIIVRKNEIITNNIINKAKKHNKINLLTYFSR